VDRKLAVTTGRNVARRGGGSATGVNRRPRGKRGEGCAHTADGEKNGGEKRGVGGGDTHFKGVGGVEQRRGQPGVVPRAAEVGEGRGGIAQRSGGVVDRQWPEANRHGAAMPHGRSEQGRGGRLTGGVGWHSADQRGLNGIQTGSKQFKLIQTNFKPFKFQPV
jgi:hypothetical protein